MNAARPRFRPSYGSGEGIAELVGVAVQAGASIASTAITTSAQGKIAASQRAHETRMARLDAKRAELEAQIEAAQQRQLAKAAAKKSAPARSADIVPLWAVGLGAAVLLAVGGVLIYRSRKKPAAPTEVE